MDFKETYQEAMYVAKYLINRGRQKFQYEEVISEAYLMCDGDIDLKNIKKNMVKFLSQNKFNYLKDVPTERVTAQGCKSCLQVKPIDLFRRLYNKQLNTYHHLPVCQKCEYKYYNILATTKKWQKEKRWIPKHREKILATKKRYREKNRDRIKERDRENSKVYFQKNKAKIYERNREREKTESYLLAARIRQRRFRERKKLTS